MAKEPEKNADREKAADRERATHPVEEPKTKHVDVMKKAMEPDRTDPKPGEHVPAKDFRFRVENTAAGDLNMDPREPYPTGNPPDPREAFYMINGFFPGEGGPGGIAGARDTRGPNPKD